MNTLFTYSIHAGIFLLFGYLAYSLFAADAMRPRVSRILLWAVMLTSLLMPLCPDLCLFTPAGADAAADMAIGRPEVVGIEAVTRLSEFIKYIPTLYMAGFLLSLAVMISAIIRLVMLIGKGRKERRGLITLVRLDRKMSPFSWMGYVFIGKDDDSLADTEMILSHEMAHIRRRHSLDLALAGLICALMWYNPAVWLWRRQLAMVHEYEADSDVVTAGFDMKAYQILLIKKAVGPRLQSLANNLTHSKLKKRITMMSKKQSKRGALVRTLAVVPAIVGALAVVNIPAVASALDRISPAEVQPFGEVNQNLEVSQVETESVAIAATEAAAADCMPSFPGGWDAMARYLMDNLTYPEQAKKDGLEGRVVVRFKVDTDGSIGDISVIKSLNSVLDSEAIRVVKAMPRWTPGRENGKTVAVSMSIPIEFKLK